MQKIRFSHNNAHLSLCCLHRPKAGRNFSRLLIKGLSQMFTDKACKFIIWQNEMSHVMRKKGFAYGVYQLHRTWAADQCLCFGYMDCTISLFSKKTPQTSNHLLWLYNPVCAGRGRKPRRRVFSHHGSNNVCLLVSWNGI